MGCMLIKKPLERRCGNRLRRMPCNLPTLKRLKFCRQSRRVEEFHCLGLAKVVGLSPGFEALNNPGAINSRAGLPHRVVSVHPVTRIAWEDDDWSVWEASQD